MVDQNWWILVVVVVVAVTVVTRFGTHEMLQIGKCVMILAFAKAEMEAIPCDAS